MAERFDVAVVGAGMIGACAAWQIASRGLSVALVGPGEPADPAAHEGVFASHYDQGRITRILDSDPLWGRLALASIERYRDLEAESGIGFYQEAGCLRLGQAGEQALDRADRNGATLGADHRRLGAGEMQQMFSALRLPVAAQGLYEHRRAGHINPRALVAAARAATVRRGGVAVGRQAVSVIAGPGGCRVTLDHGDTVDAGRVLVATGAFGVMAGILPRRLDLVVEPRTVVMFTCSRSARAALAGLPSLITSIDGDGQAIDLYAVPPVAYPDGTVRFKAGSGAFSEPLDTSDGDEAVRAWFRGTGRAHEIAYIRTCVESLLPGLRGAEITTSQCAVTQTATGHPYIGLVDGGPVGVAIGGNGYAAKSAIEIGRIAGDMIIDGDPRDRAETFAPRFDD